MRVSAAALKLGSSSEITRSQRPATRPSLSHPQLAKLITNLNNIEKKRQKTLKKMKLLENNSFERLSDALTTEDSMDGRIDARIESYRFFFGNFNFLK